MEVATSLIHSYYAVSPLRPFSAASTSSFLAPSIAGIKIPTISSINLPSKCSGFLLPCEKTRPFSSSIAACLDNTTAITTNDSIREQDGAIKGNGDDLENRNVGSEQLDDKKMVRICIKLIEVFMVDKPTPNDWKRLLTFSKEWDNIRPHFFKLCQDRADDENDPGMKHKLLRLARKLKEVDEDIQRHNELLDVIKKSPSEIREIVSKRRKDFTKEFFFHIQTVAESYYDNPTEQNAVAKLGNISLAAVKEYDTATETMESLNAAELKFQDIINAPSVEAACRKIDDLAEKNQLDSTLALMISKAWSTAKESTMMKEEAKDVLFHLYQRAIGNLQRNLPKEIRILKYLLTIEDPEECMSSLRDAFTPGEELEGTNVDSLYTTPEQLYTWIQSVVDAYHSSKEGTLIKEARDLMNPKIVEKMERLKKTIRDNFM